MRISYRAYIQYVKLLGSFSQEKTFRIMRQKRKTSIWSLFNLIAVGETIKILKRFYLPGFTVNTYTNPKWFCLMYLMKNTLLSLLSRRNNWDIKTCYLWFFFVTVDSSGFPVDSIYILMKDESWMIFLWKNASTHLILLSGKHTNMQKQVLKLEGQFSFSLNFSFSKNPHCHALYCSSARSFLC